MTKFDEYMAVATPGGDVIRRRVATFTVNMDVEVTHRKPMLEADELLVERLGKIPMIIKAHA